MEQQEEEAKAKAALESVERDRQLARALKKQQRKARRQAAERLEEELFNYAVLLDNWEQEQQTALELALLDFPSSVEKTERWTKISEAVPGKSKQQCLARYKYLKKLVTQRFAQPTS